MSNLFSTKMMVFLLAGNRIILKFQKTSSSGAQTRNDRHIELIDVQIALCRLRRRIHRSSGFFSILRHIILEYSS